MAELPYQAEYAKSGRAACKGCKEKIDQGTLRIAIMVQSAFHDGKQPNWHHEECFFKRQRPTTIADISNFNKLKHPDQLRVKQAIENYTGIVMPDEGKKGKGKKTAKKRGADKESAMSSSALKDFRVEYSKSSRATCCHCEIKICKDEVRICKVVFDTEVGSKYGGQPLWHHVKCFDARRSQLLYFAGGDSLPGFNILKKDDQAMVKNEIKSLKTDEVPVKKLKAEPKDAAEQKEDMKKNKLIEKQNKLFHKHRSALSVYQKRECEELLEHNSQEILSSRDECLDHLADIMAFGALNPCPECKQGQLVLDTFGYKCTGDISAWTKCSYVTQDPQRVPMKVPSAYKESSVFKKFKPKTDVRVFMAAPPPTIIVKPEVKIEKKDIPIPPLKNLQFFLYGKLKDKEETKRRILKLGGLVVSRLTDTAVAVVSTKGDVERMPAKMEEIKEKEIEVVEHAYLDLIDAEKGTIADSLQLIKENNIADWGSGPETRLPQDVLNGKSIPKSGSNYVSGELKSVKLKIKGGTAVDPESGLEDSAHVYKDDEGSKYTVTLCKTDVVAKKNSYYKLQVLEKDDKKQFYLFRSWGRIGTTYGNNKLEECKSVDDAVYKFENIYMEKTENPWQCRDMFEKIPGCYYPMDVDYGDDEPDAVKLQVDKSCALPIPVQKLVSTIFDIDIMKKTLLEFELDTTKMPLGKISKKQIKTAYTVLKNIFSLIEKGTVNQNKILDATNRFFTLIPHDFGAQNAPLLDNAELIQKKTEMLDNLLEIEIAYSLLKSDESSTRSPIESHYLKLKTHLAPLDGKSEEFAMIEEYTRNTHASSHSFYTLKIQEVFKVVRDGEDKRYKPFRKLHNRRLLWHGSRVTNFAGILSQGLRIAPPEAPVTGYMFGKGVYFADMVSKSANYCATNQSNPTGLLLLCEVALGNMKEYYQAENVKLPADKHSAWGVGRTEPDAAAMRTLDDGTLVPLGKPVTKKVPSALLYNEFIVYDVAQINVKYLVQMKFNYNK